MRQLRVPVLVTAVAMLLAACSSGGDDASATPISEIGEGEGELNLVIWTGYAERGEADAAYDWVTPFEDETGCIVNTTDMSDSNNGVSLIQSGEYDGISASGDATTRLIASGLAAPIDTSVFENYDAVFDSLKDLPAQHGRWRQLRRSPWPWRERPRLEHGRGHRGPDVVGHHLGAGRRLRG